MAPGLATLNRSIVRLAAIAPDLVELVTVPDVELIEVGTWQASTGVHTWTTDDLQAAVAAFDDPAYNTPIVKLGHVKTRGVEWPAVGRIENVRLNASKTTLIGDLVGVPKWLATVMPTSYPKRSVEGEFGFKTATGTEHRFALTAVALLGETAPAIATLEDVKTLLVGDGSTTEASRRVTLTVNGHGRPMPVAAAISVDTLREAFYDATPPGSWAWIREVYVGNDAFVIVDDDEGSLFRIPWTEADGTVSFGEPQKVVIEYVSSTDTDDENEAELVLLSREPMPAVRPVRATTEEANMPVTLTAEQLTAIGLEADATAEQITERTLELAAWAAAERDALAAAATAEPPAPDPENLPDGMTLIDAAQLQDLVAAGAAGRTAAETLRVRERDEYLRGAVRLGKIPPARLAYWKSYYDRDEAGARSFVDAAAAVVPLTPLGGDDEGEIAGDDAVYASLFPNDKQPARAGGKA